MNISETNKCGGDCRCWRRCNYCRYCGVIEDGKNGYPAFYCMNKEFPICYDGDGFECIFSNIPKNCIGKLKHRKD